MQAQSNARRVYTEYKYLRDASPQFPHWRPTILRMIGARMIPSTVTRAWYAADCPPRVDLASVASAERMRFRASLLLRGVARNGEND